MNLSRAFGAQPYSLLLVVKHTPICPKRSTNLGPPASSAHGVRESPVIRSRDSISREHKAQTERMFKLFWHPSAVPGAPGAR